MSSDDILYLDPDHENALMSNGTQPENNGTEKSKEASQVPYSMDTSRETTGRPLGTSTDDVCPQKKAIKPPMPPTKETKPTAPEVESEKEDCPTKRVCKILLHSFNALIYRSMVGHDFNFIIWTLPYYIA